jgi:hypothetical protein
VRHKAAASSPEVVAWLDKVVKPVLANARRGAIPMQEQQVSLLLTSAMLSPVPRH